jgi:HK97 gp10 family phage protein
MSVKYTSFSDDVKKMLNEKKKEAHTAIGIFVAGEAQVRVPVDTGRLKNSIDYKSEQKQVTIGTNVEYAPYVEKGTSKRAAKPYLEPAVLENWNEIKKIAEGVFNG